jgi:hypothetical protein
MSGESAAPRLSSAAQDLLRRRMSGVARRESGLRVVRRADRPVLSSAQRRLWFVDKLSPGAAGYNVPVCYRLCGHLDVSALRTALDDVVARHEVLRTRFADFEGEPFQVVDPPKRIHVRTVDLTTTSDALSEAAEVVRANENAPFDLSTGPLLRTVLVRLGQDDHLLSFAVHHTVFDRESLEIFNAELSAVYNTAIANGQATLPPPPVHYADFAEWQRQEADDRQLSYWESQLTGVPDALDLPTDRPRPAMPSHRADAVEVHVPAATTQAVHELALAHRMSPFMVCLAAYQAVLARHTGASDIVVGCPVDLRSQHSSLRRVIGFFANTLPIRVRTNGTLRFSELLDRVRDTVLTAYEHQAVPFDRIVERVSPSRDLSRNPLTQVWFDLAGPAAPGSTAVELTGIRSEYFDTGNARARFDLELHLHETPDGSLSGPLLYATDLFDRETVEPFARHFVNFLTTATTIPASRLAEIQMFDDDELDRIINGLGAESAVERRAWSEWNTSTVT